ncbi:MAG TPA: LacI family DNA-binding transcriptional regulator [Verrucomicrobiae bacterium]|nr:LacI family DNA-binding transcriptional regulator [Verrucomicrobiae bacterium]
MVRLKDIAERAGVSMMTVSKALRGAPDVAESTRTRLKLLAQQMGYVPDSTAQGLRNGRTRIFGLVIPSMANPIFARLVLAIQERAYEMGYDVLLGFTLYNVEREESWIRRFLSRRVDGLLIAPVYRLEQESAVYKELIARKTPVVLLGHSAPFCSGFVSVATDDATAGFNLTQHLLQLGHKKIAFLSGPPATPWTRERFEGYRRALRQAGMEVDERFIFQAGRTTEDGAKAAVQMLHEAPDATAVQAINDLVAVGCAEVLLKQGVRIPEDISVVGFGNTMLSEFFRMPLTTVDQPKHRLGSAAIDAMTQLLRGARPESKRLPAPVIARASSGTAPATTMPERLRQLKT